MNGDEPGSSQPSWMPADGVLPAIVPVGRFLIRSPQIVVALSHVAAYPNGCMFDVQIGTRGRGHGLDIDDGFDRLVFAVRFGAGIAAVMDDEEPWRSRSRGEDRLLLMRFGYQTSSDAEAEGPVRRADGAIWLWLHPLPPPEAGTLSVVAPDLGSGLTACPLDGRAVVAAARQAQPYWL